MIILLGNNALELTRTVVLLNDQPKTGYTFTTFTNYTILISFSLKC